MDATEHVTEPEAQEEVSVEELAEKVRAFLAGNPKATVDEVAAATDSTHGQVTTILNEWSVQEGHAVFVGPGFGGGWVPEQPDAVYGRPGDE